jgi:hypothetical protein
MGHHKGRNKEEKGYEQSLIVRTLKWRQKPGVGVDFAVPKIL